MKQSAIALSLIAILLSAGCSDKHVDKSTAAPAASPAAPAAPVDKVSALSKEVPAEMKEFAFENAGSCSIDIINNAMLGAAPEVTINRADGLNVDGWAFDEKAAAVPAIVALQLAKGEEHYYAPVNRHGGRTDLTTAYGTAEFANAGYAAPVDIASLPAGQYEILVVQKGVTKNMVCSTNRKLNLKD